MPPTAGGAPGGAAWYMARHAAGRPNIITGKKPAMNAPALGSPAKNRFRSPVAPLIIAEDEPGDVVEDVVQAGDDQQPVEHAVDEQAESPEPSDGPAQRVHAAARASASQPNTAARAQARDAADDRHEAAAAEEGQVVRQLECREAVVERAADQAGDDADRHAQLGDLLGLERRRRQVDRARRSGSSARRAARRSGSGRPGWRSGSRRRRPGPPRRCSRAPDPPRRRSRTAGRGWRRSRRRPRPGRRCSAGRAGPAAAAAPATGSTAIGSISARPSGCRPRGAIS